MEMAFGKVPLNAFPPSNKLCKDLVLEEEKLRGLWSALLRTSRVTRVELGPSRERGKTPMKLSLDSRR